MCLVVVLPDSFWEIGTQSNRTQTGSWVMHQGLNHKLKIVVEPKLKCWRGSDADSQERGQSHSVVDECRHCKNYPFTHIIWWWWYYPIPSEGWSQWGFPGDSETQQSGIAQGLDNIASSSGSGATWPLSGEGDGGAEEFCGTQQSGHVPSSRPEVKNGRSSVKDGTPERFRCGNIQKEVS